MPTYLQVIHAKEFVKATPEGLLDLQETTRMLSELASLSPPGHDYHILIDTRHAQVEMSLADLHDIASEAGERHIPYGCKVAMLCPPKDLEDARFLELCSQNRGINAAAFVSFEEAISWLCGIEGTPCSDMNQSK